MTQPTFVPVSQSSRVRASLVTPTPEIGRPKKAGLLGSPSDSSGAGRGTTGPDAGYALTLAERAVQNATLERGESTHDIVVGVAMLAAKRAALSGRGPTMSDVTVVLDLFGFRSDLTDDEASDRRRRFSGIAHSYVAQRALVDSVNENLLNQTESGVLNFWSATS